MTTLSLVPQPTTLARFRADPRRVRISVCWLFDSRLWRVTIAERSGAGQLYTARHFDPEQAVQRALAHAVHHDLDGVDLSMGWAYEHPFGAVGVAARGVLS